MKSTEEPGVNIINKPDWVKKSISSKQQWGELAFGQSRGCGQSVCV